MREFLLALYLQHGEREFRYTDLNISGNREGFVWKYNGDKITISIGALLEKDFIIITNQNKYDMTKRIQFHLTPKAIEYIKNLDNP